MTKKITLLITFLLAIVVLASLTYSFNEAKKLAVGQIEINKKNADLEKAKQKLAEENLRLREIRSNSYFVKSSQAEYEKTKKLVSKLDIFFNNAESDHPEIKFKTSNDIVREEINNKRKKINEILKTWKNNNDNSLETDQKLIQKIKTYLLIIQAYIEQLQKIVNGLSTTNSGLTSGEINSYNNLIQNSSQELAGIITNINQTANIINNTATSTDPNNHNSTEVEDQIKIVIQAEKVVTDLENQINNPPNPILPATTTPIVTSTSTNSESTTTTTTTPNIVIKKRVTNLTNPQNSNIIYESTPAPYQDNGVDTVNDPTKPLPLQDW